jgi:hypothetical protein
VNELLQQLHNARQHAAGGAMDQAEKYIDEAWELLENALAKRPGPKMSARAVLGYLSEARFALVKGDHRRATQALDHALRTLEETPAKGE